VRLAEILALRPVPAAGLFLALTRRCPLRCAHCSTDSSLSSEEHPAAPFRRLVGSFTTDDRPELILMSGGEALLRPALVRDLANLARELGTRSYVISGMFFARRAGPIPPRLREAIDAVDHFAASLDEFHEREVRREDVFAVLDELLCAGKDCSLQVVGRGTGDAYLRGLLDAVHARFGPALPVLVGSVGAAGRALEWLPPPQLRAARADPPGPLAVLAEPCALANWPLVGYDGTVLACCHQEILDSGRPPPHLVLGHARQDGWATLRERYLRSPMLRGLRTFGPRYLRAAFAAGETPCAGYCATCERLPGAAMEPALAAYLATPGAQLLESEVRRMAVEAGAAGFVRRYGIPEYAPLVGIESALATEGGR
jgi:hypothetical protein